MDKMQNSIFDLMLKEAVAANFRNEMNALPSEEALLEAYAPSRLHIRNMNALFSLEKRRKILQGVQKAAKAAAILLCIAATLILSSLLLNPDVRAAAKNTVVEFFEGFARIAFRNSEEAVGTAREYTLRHIPEGYVLESVEEYGDNCMWLYVDDIGNLLIFDIGPPAAYSVDDDNRTYYTEVYDGVEYHIFATYKDHYTSAIIWDLHGFTLSLDGSLSVAELLETAFSLEFTG